MAQQYAAMDIIDDKHLGNELLDAALEYAARGWAVFPCHSIRDGKCTCDKGEACESPGKHPEYDGKDLKHGCHSATNDRAQIIEWWRRYPDANVGIATGEMSGFFVLDIDLKNDGPDNLFEIERECGKLPETVESQTGSGGRHILFIHPGFRIGNKIGFKPGLDIRGDGGYIVAPPSIHESGRRYEWEMSSLPDDVPLAEAPQWLIDLITKPDHKQSIQVAGDPPAKIPEGKRNSTLTSLAGSLRQRGCGQETILAALLAENKARCQPPLSEDEVQKIAGSISRYEPATNVVQFKASASLSKCPAGLGMTDLGTAERLITTHGKHIRYCNEKAEWLVYDGKRWLSDKTRYLETLAKDVVTGMFDEASAISDDDKRKKVMDVVKRFASHNKLQAMINVARSDRRVSIMEEQLDQNPWLLNCQNGTLDLRTGTLAPHRIDDLITRISPSVFDPDAKCPLWDRFLDRIMAGNTQLISFLQRVVGYALTDDTREQVIFFLYGRGANGKTTFIEVIRTLLGDYAQQADFTTFLKKKNDAARNDIARLKGARFVSAAEVGAGRQLDEVLIKHLAGGDRVAARFLFKEFMEFASSFKIFLAGNHKPVVKGTDDGIWRRIRLIPFSVRIPDDEMDRNLLQKLKTELPGILAWAVRGCIEWQLNGLGFPAEVKSATAEYRQEMDIFGRFFEEFLETGPKFRQSVKDLYEKYRKWYESNGEKPMSNGDFSRQLKDRGYSNSRSGQNGSYEWHGFRLREDL
jgi:putative DNA primase/helicase